MSRVERLLGLSTLFASSVVFAAGATCQFDSCRRISPLRVLHPERDEIFAAATDVSLSVKNSFVDIWPVLFPEEVETVYEVAGEPLLTNLGPGLVLLRVVEGGDARCGAGADNL